MHGRGNAETAPWRSREWIEVSLTKLVCWCGHERHRKKRRIVAVSRRDVEIETYQESIEELERLRERSKEPRTQKVVLEKEQSEFGKRDALFKDRWGSVDYVTL